VLGDRRCLIPAGHGVVAAKPREPCDSSRLSSVHCTNVSVHLSSSSPAAVYWCVRARCGRFSKRKSFFCCLLRNLSERVNVLQQALNCRPRKLREISGCR
jgi:hypothetical protein